MELCLMVYQWLLPHHRLMPDLILLMQLQILVAMAASLQEIQSPSHLHKCYSYDDYNNYYNNYNNTYNDYYVVLLSHLNFIDAVVIELQSVLCLGLISFRLFSFLLFV